MPISCSHLQGTWWRLSLGLPPVCKWERMVLKSGVPPPPNTSWPLLPQLWVGCHSERMSGRGNAVTYGKWAPGPSGRIAPCARPWGGRGAGAVCRDPEAAMPAACGSPGCAHLEPGLQGVGVLASSPPQVSLSCASSLGVGGEKARGRDWALGQLDGTVGPQLLPLEGEFYGGYRNGLGPVRPAHWPSPPIQGSPRVFLGVTLSRGPLKDAIPE